MIEIIKMYLIVCPLVFLGGFVDAVAGGGGFISLPAYILSGVPVHTAIGTNKLSSAMGTSLTTYQFAKNGYIKIRIAIYCVVFALLGSYLGAKTALLINAETFKIIMLIILPITSIYVFFKKDLIKDIDEDQESDNDMSSMRTLYFSLAISFFIGIYDGFYGPGTGTFLILLLTGVAHMKLNEAAGITKVINLTTNITSLVIYLLNGKVIVIMGIIAGCFGIIGNYLGTKYFRNKGAKGVKPIILIVLSIFFVKLLLEVF